MNGDYDKDRNEFERGSLQCHFALFNRTLLSPGDSNFNFESARIDVPRQLRHRRIWCYIGPIANPAARTGFVGSVGLFDEDVPVGELPVADGNQVTNLFSEHYNKANVFISSRYASNVMTENAALFFNDNGAGNQRIVALRLNAKITSLKLLPTTFALGGTDNLHIVLACLSTH